MRRGIVYVLPGIAILCLSVSQTDRQTVNTGLNRLTEQTQYCSPVGPVKSVTLSIRAFLTYKL